jgi:hypothetical protein
MLDGVNGTGFMTVEEDNTALDVPDRFCAVTENTYDMPFVNPGMMIGLDVPFAVNPPG